MSNRYLIHSGNFPSLQLIVFTLLVFFLSAPVMAQKIKGNKNVLILQREIDDFDSIIVKSDFEVELYESDMPEVSVETDENLHDYIKTRVNNGTLELYQSARITRKKTLVIRVGVTDMVDYIEARGRSHVYGEYDMHFHFVSIRALDNSNISLSAINAENLKLYGESRSTVKLSGEVAGNMEISLSGHCISFINIINSSTEIQLNDESVLKITGTTDELNLQSNDNGDFKGKDYLTGFADVVASGTTDTEINTSEQISIDLSGKAELYLYGQPANIIVQNLNGKSTIFKK